MASYLRTLPVAVRPDALLDGPATYCSFFGYQRSGHSLVAQLLNAHRQVVISNELNVFRFVRSGVFSRRQLYSLILKRDQWYTSRSSSSRYSYAVPGQWQGRVEDLRVIGDKKGGGSSQMVSNAPHLLARLRRTVQVPLRFVHVLRNPFDNIATISRRWNLPLERAVDHYFMLVSANAAIERLLGPEELLHVRLESLISLPRDELRALCRFVEVDADGGYLDACAAVVLPAPRRTRHTVAYTPRLIEAVEKRMAPVGFLQGYAWDT